MIASLAGALDGRLGPPNRPLDATLSACPTYSQESRFYNVRFSVLEPKPLAGRTFCSQRIYCQRHGWSLSLHVNGDRLSPIPSDFISTVLRSSAEAMSNDPATDKNGTITLAVRGVRCRDPHAEWLGEPGTNSDRGVITRLFWRRVPLQKDAVQAMVRATAAAVLSRVDEWNLSPARPWLTFARSLAGACLLPIPANYEPAAHLVEFRRLLPNEVFRIRVGIGPESGATDEDLSAVERILQWACDLLEGDALVFLPSVKEAAVPETPDVPEPEIIAPPLRGKPHPLSDSEQKLAKLIAADSHLAPLFSFNTPVRLGPLSRPCVDLCWEAGKLVVEIDDASHWQKLKYAADRQRDFELMASGFMVLRITSEEVLQDAGKALHKIRTCVDLRRQS